MRRRWTAAAILGAAVLVASPAVATAQVSTTTSATFSGARSEPGGSAEAYCGGAGQDACTSGNPVQVSWGIGGSGQRSSLGFQPANAAGLGEFSLGTLTHTNTVVGLINGITAVNFRVDTTVRDSDRSVEFSASLPMRLDVHEVIDSVRPCPYGEFAGQCADAVSLPRPNASFPYEVGNVAYLLQIVGFYDDGQMRQHTISPEDGSTDVQLIARLTKTPRLAADAGPDQAVDEGGSVILDGSASRYRDLTYAWRQLSGPTVTLNDPTAVRPTFPVGLFTEDQTLEFELTVRDRLEPAYVDQDTVQVTVRDLNDPPNADADTGGTGYEVPEGGEIALAGSATDPDGNITTIAWDFDGDGDFGDATGEAPVFSAVGLDGPDQVTVALRVCDTFGVCAEDSAQVRIINVAPVVDLGEDREVYRNDVVALSGTFEDPAGALDDPYTASWSGKEPLTPATASATFGVPVDRKMSYPLEGTYTVDLEVTDKDDGSGRDSLTLTVLNRDPSCATATPTVASLWAPNHKPVPVGVTGLTDPEGDALTVTVTGIRQDEPVRDLGSGRTEPDASGVGTATALLMAERSGRGDGRVYHVAYTVDDGHGGNCTGTVTVGVPHDQRGAAPVDQGPLHNSTVVS